MTNRVLPNFWTRRILESFEGRKESLETRGDAGCFQYFHECVKIFLSFKKSIGHGKSHCLLFIEDGFLHCGLLSFRPHICRRQSIPAIDILPVLPPGFAHFFVAPFYLKRFPAGTGGIFIFGQTFSRRN